MLRELDCLKLRGREDSVPQASEGCSMGPRALLGAWGSLQLCYLLQERDGGRGRRKTVNVPEDPQPVWSGCLAA